MGERNNLNFTLIYLTSLFSGCPTFSRHGCFTSIVTSRSRQFPGSFYHDSLNSQEQPPDVLYKKCRSFRPATILKGLQHRCFPVNINKFLTMPTLKNSCEQLLLKSHLSY